MIWRKRTINHLQLEDFGFATFWSDLQNHLTVCQEHNSKCDSHIIHINTLDCFQSSGEANRLLAKMYMGFLTNHRLLSNLRRINYFIYI